MELAFKKANGPGTTDTDRLIANNGSGPFTGRYSHVELVLDQLIPHAPGGIAMCFSAVMGEPCRWKTIELDPAKWDVVPLPSTLEQESNLYQWCHGVQGVPYDTPGVFAFATPLAHENKNAFFCSELCTNACQKFLGLFARAVACDTRPNDLAEWVNEIEL